MTTSRLAEYVGGGIGLFIGGAVSAAYYLATDRLKLVLFGGICLVGLFGGAWVGKQIVAVFKRK